MKKEDLVALGLDEEMAKKVASASLEELHEYVPKSRFEEVTAEKNTLKATLAERDEQLAGLQSSSNDSESLKQQIADLIKANADAQAAHDAEIKQLKIDNAIEKALGDAGALNSKAVALHLGITYLCNKSMSDIRADVYQLFLAVENNPKFRKTGKAKMKWVLGQARELLPGWMQIFVTDVFLERVIEGWFEAVKDLLDDGKYNKSVKKGGIKNV